MSSQFLPIALAFALLPAVTLADGRDTARYQLVAVSGGFVRLDTMSGAMTFCRGDQDAMKCTEVQGIRAAKGVDRRQDKGVGNDTDKGAGKGRGDGIDKRPDVAPLKEGKDTSFEDFDRALSAIERTMRSVMQLSAEKPKDCTL